MITTAQQTKVTGEMVVAAARKYVGVPFVDRGRDRNEGLDCIGLLLCVARDLDLRFPQDIVGYSADIRFHPRASGARKLLSQHLVLTHERGAGFGEVLYSARPGDICFGEISGLAMGLLIVSELREGTIPIQTVIGCLPTAESVVEIPFCLSWGCSITDCFRFREVK